MPRESSRRDVAQYDLLHERHESHQQLSLMAKSGLSRGGPPSYDSVQAPRGPSSYIPSRESQYTPALRETPYSTPPPHQSRQGLSGPHTPTPHSTLQPPNYTQGHHSHYPPPRPQTCSPYRPVGPPSGPQSGPYPPPSSIPPSQPPHHPPYGQPPPPQQHPGNCHTPPPQGQYPRGHYEHDRGRPY